MQCVIVDQDLCKVEIQKTMISGQARSLLACLPGPLRTDLQRLCLPLAHSGLSAAGRRPHEYAATHLIEYQHTHQK